MKTFKKILIALVVFLILIFVYFYVGLFSRDQEIEWGITFSRGQAEGLGLDWQETYLAILDDLKVDNIRLSAYWNEVEPEDDEFDFSILDFQIEEAAKRDVDILLAVGRRLPRWPECHVPGWAGELPMDVQNQKLLETVSLVVDRYKDVEAVKMWQVENEFFLTGFGICDPVEKSFFDDEVNLVRSMDDRPIVTTDSGELGDWARAMNRGDIFGTTMYRRVYNQYLGFATYPIAPVYYKRRFLLFKPFFRADRIIGVELQAEPWSRINNLREDKLEDWNITMSPELFEGNIDYARKSGIDLHYLWGAEWWYYAKEQRDHEIIWETAKKLWSE